MDEYTDQPEVLDQEGEPEVPETPEGEQEQQASEEGEQQPQSKSQNAKQRLRRKLREEQAARFEAEERSRQLEEKFSALESKLEGVINPPPPRPSRDDFDSEEQYEDALLDWRIGQQSSSPVSEPAAASAQQDYGQAPQAPQESADIVSPEVRKNWESQLETASDKYDDFEDAMFSIPRESMTDNMTFAIMESDQGGEVAYFLGNNHSEAARIAGLTPAQQIREIDALASKFKPKQTSAPEPVRPISGSGDSGGKDPEKMSPEEYRRWRNSQRPAHY